MWPLKKTNKASRNISPYFPCIPVPLALLPHAWLVGCVRLATDPGAVLEVHKMVGQVGDILILLVISHGGLEPKVL